jgi:hypothetical protein
MSSVKRAKFWREKLFGIASHRKDDGRRQETSPLKAPSKIDRKSPVGIIKIPTAEARDFAEKTQNAIPFSKSQIIKAYNNVVNKGNIPSQENIKNEINKLIN